MKFASGILLYIFFSLACAGEQQTSPVSLNADTIAPPSHMSKDAQLLNFGSDTEPIMVWIDYIGPLQKDGELYPHIIGFQYYYLEARQKDTFYYENFDLRHQENQQGFQYDSIFNYPGEATIMATNGKDSILLFNVGESDEFSREHRGTTFKRMPTVSKRGQTYMADEDIEFNLKVIENGKCEITLNNGSKLLYQLCEGCKPNTWFTSFLNREDGKIYLLERNCFLELVNNADLKKINQK